MVTPNFTKLFEIIYLPWKDTNERLQSYLISSGFKLLTLSIQVLRYS